MPRSFDTPEPVALYLEIGSGEVSITATQTDHTAIEVTGRDADEVQIEQHGRTIAVIQQQQHRGWLGRGSAVEVTISVPGGSDLTGRLGSAELHTQGSLGDCSVKSGSGRIRLERRRGIGEHRQRRHRPRPGAPRHGDRPGRFR